MEEEAVCVDEGVGCPGNWANCGDEEVEVGFCGMVEILFALDLRLEPNPRLLKRAFIELIRSTKGGYLTLLKEVKAKKWRKDGGMGNRYDTIRYDTIRWRSKSPVVKPTYYLVASILVS